MPIHFNGYILRALLLSFMAIPANAQVLYGSLTGNVTDATGSAVPNARVEALNSATGLTRQATSDERGGYLFNDLQPGRYRVTVAAPSFGTIIQEGVEIAVNTVRRYNPTLSVAQVNESVTIAASGAMLQTERADVSAELQRSQITNLPIGNQRNFQALYKIIPGFSPPADAHSDAGNPQRSIVTNVNGVSRTTNNTRLDGSTISFPWLPHIVAYVPPAEAVETVNIVTNSFDAEQGMAGGAAVNVQIKSGTNEFHGSGHWFHTNSALKARNFFSPESRLPKNILNQFGGTIGGPIKKNKLFFFADWERTVRRQAAQAFRTVATNALRQGDFGATGTVIYDPRTGNPDGTGRQPFPNNRIPLDRIDPASRTMAGLIPQPNLPSATNNLFASGTYEYNRDNSDIKVNYNPTDRASMFARYSFSPSEIFDPPSLGDAGGDALAGGQPGLAPGLIQNSAIGGTYTVSPTVLVDGNFGFTRQRLGAENIDIDTNYGLDVLNIPGTNGPDRLQGGYPRFVFTTFSNIGNPNNSNPFLFRDHQWVGAGNVSILKGAHSIRMGAEYQYFTINHFQPEAANGPRGAFTFSGGLTALRATGAVAPNLYNTWADFLLGLPQAMGKDLQYLNPATVRMPSYGFYIRDQWQVTRKLTFNFGTRFEIYPVGRRDHHGPERYDPDTDKVYVGGLGDIPSDAGIDTGKGQFAPRLGIAYRVTDRTVVRTGYGISVDPMHFKQLRNAYPAVISQQLTGASSFEQAGTLRTGLPPIVGPDPRAAIIDLPPSVGTVTFPNEFRRGYIQSFNFAIQQDLGGGFNGQVAYVGTRAIRQTAQININAAGPGGGAAGRALAQRWPGRIGNINLFTPYNSAHYNGLQAQLNRRFQAGSHLGVSYTLSRAINYADDSDSSLTWNWTPMLERNRAVAGFDRTHNLQIFGVYELPFGKGKRWATSGPNNWLLGGWQANGIFSVMSGIPFSLLTAGTSVNAPGSTQTADQVMPEVAILGKAGRGESYFDPYAFAPVTDVRFGNTGRNLLRGPGVINLDASVFRDFNVTERLRMQFRAEAFNVSNTPKFNNPGSTVSSATRNAAGVITALNNYSEITSTSALHQDRQLRFALKLFF